MKKQRKQKYHGWLVRNKDWGEYLSIDGTYTDKLAHATLFRTRQLARECIHENDTVNEEMPMKVLLLNGKRFVINDKKQLYLDFS